MAGHSHSKNVKRIKEAGAKKRALAFAKIGRNISLLAKQGGGDINSNPALRAIIEKSKEINLPKENIEKAIKRGIGESDGSGALEEFLFEGYGPGDIAIIVEGITDNKNRSMAEFKKIMNRHNSKVASPGAVKWMFKRRGLVVIECDNCNKAELTAIEMGADETGKNSGILKVTTKPENMERIKRGLENAGYKAESSLRWIPSSSVVISESDRKKAELLFGDLNSSEEIQEIYSNIKE